MEEVKIFRNERFGEIRTAGTSDEPLFCLADVCRAIGIKDVPRCASRLEDDMRQTRPISDSMGRMQRATFVTEGGLYDVIIRSDSAAAKPFRRWVTSEVLPSIRKTGGYIAAGAGDTPEEIMARALLVAQETLKRREERIKAMEAENREMAGKIEADAPKVLFANALKASGRSILVGELAKILKQNGCETGQKRLFAWLRENGYLMKGGSERNQPTQRSMELGLFEVTKGVVTRPDDTVITTVTTKVTPKGQEYFVNKLAGAGKPGREGAV